MMPDHRTDGPEWPEWSKWLLGLVATSAIFAGIWGLVTRDTMQTVLAAALPFAFVGACLLITLTWALIIIPLLLFVGKVFGEKKNHETEPKANEN